jgi:hypothetical protein
LATIVASGATYDDDVAQRPNAAVAQLAIIADRTINAATLVRVVSHHNADPALLLNLALRPTTTLATLEAIAANGNVNLEVLTAVHNHASVNPALKAQVERHPIYVAELERIRQEQAQGYQNRLGNIPQTRNQAEINLLILLRNETSSSPQNIQVLLPGGSSARFLGVIDARIQTAQTEIARAEAEATKRRQQAQSFQDRFAQPKPPGRVHRSNALRQLQADIGASAPEVQALLPGGSATQLLYKIEDQLCDMLSWPGNEIKRREIRIRRTGVQEPPFRIPSAF